MFRIKRTLFSTGTLVLFFIFAGHTSGVSEVAGEQAPGEKSCAEAATAMELDAAFRECN